MSEDAAKDMRGIVDEVYRSESRRVFATLIRRRLGRNPEARESYRRALALTRQEPERRFLELRLAEMKN